MSPTHNSLGIELGNDNVLVTDVNSQPPTLASLFNLERSSTFLLEYLRPERLLFFLVPVALIDSSHSLIYSNFNSILLAQDDMRPPQISTSTYGQAKRM
jgi:hypothetical protein